MIRCLNLILQALELRNHGQPNFGLSLEAHLKTITWKLQTRLLQPFLTQCNDLSYLSCYLSILRII